MSEHIHVCSTQVKNDYVTVTLCPKNDIPIQLYSFHKYVFVEKVIATRLHFH